MATLRTPDKSRAQWQVGYRFARGTRVRIRARNLTDNIYTPSIRATSGRLEAPRSFDVTITKGF